MEIPYGRSTYNRQKGCPAPALLRNMYVEGSRTDRKQLILQSRSGIAPDGEYGAGPVRGVLQKDGVFGGDRFVVSGNEFYRGAVLLGTIDGTGPVSIASSDLEILITAGQTLYSYNGTDFVAVAFPNGGNVTAVAHSFGYFIAVRAGTGEWFFSAVLNGRSWDALDFATAESEPDRLLDIAVLDGLIVLFGTESVEFWASTGDNELPYSQIQQRQFERGLIATGCVVVVDNTFFYVSDDFNVYRNGDVPQSVSADDIVETIAASASHRLFLIEDERHKHICVRTDDKTYGFDVTSGEWTEFSSYARGNWRVGSGMGDDETGIVWRFEGFSDNGGILERLCSAGTSLEGPVTVNNLRVHAQVGATHQVSGQYSEPFIEMRYSDDAGLTWSPWESESLGAQGEYRTRVEWRALGMFDDPGVLFQFRVTDPVPVRISRVGVNDAVGGRQR